jgi:hypothetical protein
MNDALTGYRTPAAFGRYSDASDAGDLGIDDVRRISVLLAEIKRLGTIRKVLERAQLHLRQVLAEDRQNVALGDADCSIEDALGSLQDAMHLLRDGVNAITDLAIERAAEDEESAAEAEAERQMDLFMEGEAS